MEESAREESEALTQVEKYSVENGRLTKDLADARKAAQSLYRALLYDDLTRWEILDSAVEKWPWLAEADHIPDARTMVSEPKLCPHEAAKRYTEGVRPVQSSEAPQQSEGES
jgi:hypothetical protein